MLIYYIMDDKGMVILLRKIAKLNHDAAMDAFSGFINDGLVSLWPICIYIRKMVLL